MEHAVTLDPQRAKSIFLAALEQPEEHRRAFLDEACAGDPVLLRRAEQLLRAHERPDSLPEAAHAPGPTQDSAPPEGRARVPASSVQAEHPGAVIGPYKLVQEIGEGGMGTVWMAQQTEPVKRLVALKVIKPGMDSRQVIARFEAERQALALMDHPNIARVLDGGTTKGEPGGVSPGRPYFVMELVKGVPLTRYCDEHRLTPKERLELFVPICQAVQHAHQKGIIHRDLKPSNVLVASYDGKPVPKVIDFGIAKATGQQLTEKTLLTGFGNIVGTLEYMSPEQAELNQLDIDTRSDIYSLGVLLYELLTGSTPLEKKRLHQAAVLEVLRIIREEEPPRPSTRLSTTDELPSVAANRGLEPKKLSGVVRGELDWIVMKALEKDRNRRYETANGFATDIQRYLHDEPVVAGPPSGWYRVRKFARRNRGRLTVAAGVVLALLVMTASIVVMAASIGWAVGDRAGRRALVEVQAREALDTARALLADNQVSAARRKLVEAQALLGTDRAALGALATEVEAAAAEVDRWQRFLELIDHAHEVTAALLEATAVADGPQGGAPIVLRPRGDGRRPALAVPFLLEALQRYAILEREDWDTTLGGGFLGKHQLEQIRRSAYEELLWLADDLMDRWQEHRSGQKLSREEAAKQALVYLAKATTAHPPTQAFYVLRAECRKALGEEAAAQADRNLADRTAPTIALDHDLRGLAALHAKQLANGVQAFEAALRLEPTHYWSLMGLGACWCDLGQRGEDFATAAVVFTGCILKRPDHAHVYYCRGNAYRKLGQWEKAIADYSEAIKLEPKHASAWGGRGAVYCDRLGQPAQAVDDFSEAIKLAPKDAQAWANRGFAYFKLGKLDKAVDDCSEAIKLDSKDAHAWNNRGLAYADLRQWDKAVADFSQAIELDSKHAHAWSNRGAVYCDHLGQPAKAVDDFSEAIKLNPKFAEYWYNRGNAYRRLGELDNAAADYSKAIELDSKNAEAWNNRGLAYADLRQWDKAVADYSQAIELDSKHAEAWFNRGVANADLRQWDKAVADYSQAIELDSKHAKAWSNRGFANAKLGQLDKAIADFSQAVKLDQKHAPAHNNLAWLLASRPDAKLRDPAQAVELAKKATDLAPRDLFAWATLGAALYRAGDWKGAVAALDQSQVLNKGGNTHAWFFLAMAHQKLGDPDAARRCYDRALEWLKKNQPALAKDKALADELHRIQAEAEEVLELKK
jgi:tetratricopeptide (TPR) repeat protein/serine/threonine protein kinase